MSAMYQQWTRSYLRDQIIREELMDYKSSNFPTGRWWGDNELNYYIDEWVQDIEQQLNLVWGTFAFSIVGNTPPTSFGPPHL